LKYLTPTFKGPLSLHSETSERYYPIFTMASFIAKIISKKILGERLENNFGKDDPYFEAVPATRLDGRPSKKTKKRRKALPAGISEHDGKVLTKVKRRAYRLDMSLFNCCGIRFGWSSVIGIIPAIGDVIDAFMAIMVLRTCQQVEGGLPSSIKSKMYLNIVIDFGVGLVPFFGDLADALFRANTKNAIILEQHLREKGAKALKAQGRPAPAIDPSDPDQYDQHLLEDSPPPTYTSTTPTRQGTTSNNGHVRPVEETVPEERGGWFSRSASKKKQPDVERGVRREDPPLPGVPSGEAPGRSTLQKSRH